MKPTCALGTDAQVKTLADLLIACGAAEEPPPLVRAVYARWIDAITIARGEDVLERGARFAAPFRRLLVATDLRRRLSPAA